LREKKKIVRRAECSKKITLAKPLRRKGLLSILLCVSAPLREKNTYSSATPDIQKN
jgi:hypothetical protein